MELHIQKGTSVSLHQQIVTQISMQIVSGVLRPGTKLPSIRALAKKLGVHHNTCLSAYKELETGHLIELKHGSGAHVTMNTNGHSVSMTGTTPLSLEAIANFFVQQVLAQGYSWNTAKEALETAYQTASQTLTMPLVFVDIHSDILPLFQTELEQALQQPVRTSLINQLNPHADKQSHFIVSRYHCETLHQQLKILFGTNLSDEQLQNQITIIDVGFVQEELKLIRQLPEDSLISVISASTIILQQAEAVIKALRGEEVLLRTILSTQETTSEIQRVLKRSHIVFSDMICLPQLSNITKKAIHPIRTIPLYEIDKLTANLRR